MSDTLDFCKEVPGYRSRILVRDNDKNMKKYMQRFNKMKETGFTPQTVPEKMYLVKNQPGHTPNSLLATKYTCLNPPAAKNRILRQKTFHPMATQETQYTSTTPNPKRLSTVRGTDAFSPPNLNRFYQKTQQFPKRPQNTQYPNPPEDSFVQRFRNSHTTLPSLEKQSGRTIHDWHLRVNTEGDTRIFQ